MNDLHEPSRSRAKLAEITSIAQKAEKVLWYVMRDLKRSNAKQPAYKMLKAMGLEIFTPMVWKLVLQKGKRIPIEVPFMQDLLFVHESRKRLDPIVEKIGTLQYRFLRDGRRSPMTVRDADMARFMTAIDASENPRFYTPEEIKPTMIGKNVRIVGGALNGYEGRLQKLQGSTIKRLFVELPNLLTAAVEVKPEFIQIVK